MVTLQVPQDPLACENKTVTPGSNKVFPEIEKTDSKIFIIDEAEKASINSVVEKENDKNLEKSKEEDSLPEIEEPEEVDDAIKQQVKTKQHLFRGIVVILALCLHAVLEGLAIGLQHSIANIWYLFTAVCIHSSTIMFYVGFELLLSRTRKLTIFIHIIILSVSSPLGITIGLLITLNYNMNTRAKSAAVIFLEGLSAGTVLYVTFFEVLNREKQRRVFRMRRAICIVSGFALMAVLQCIDISPK